MNCLFKLVGTDCVIEWAVFIVLMQSDGFVWFITDSVTYVCVLML